MLKHDYFTFDICDVTTVANTHTTIPAGRHLVVELNTATGGVSVRSAGSAIDISSAEWLRLQQEGKVRK